MKMKKIFGVMLLGFMAVLLVACGQKSAEDIMKTELKDSYTGYSKEAGYEYPFSAGGDTLKFDKKNHVITNGANNENKFQVLSEKQVKELPSSFKGALDELENELKGKDNFTIAVVEFDKFEDKAFYQIVLTDSGKTIRIIELRRGYKDGNAFYDFTGKAD